MPQIAPDPSDQPADSLAAARALSRARRGEEAAALLRRLVAARPEDPDAHALLAEVLIESFDLPGAEAAIGQAIALGGPTPDRLWILATSHRRQRGFAPAAEAYGRFLALAPGDPRAETAHAERLQCLRKQALYPAAEAAAREAVAAFPASGEFLRALGEALLMQDREDEAEATLERAIAIDPHETEARDLLRAIRAGRSASPAAEPARPVKTRSWPTSLPRLGDVRQVIRSSVLRGYPEAGRFITPDTTFLTLGSCFANNLAVRLRAAGYVAHTEFLGEEVNSTYANRYLLEWIEAGPVDAQTQAMEEAYGPAVRDAFRRNFAECDVFVFTLGLAPCFFSRTSGEFFFMNGRSVFTTTYMRRNFEMKSTSVAENQDNIGRIIASVRRLTPPGARIVLSVSPVPLGATSEFASPVIGDCISKSTLRIACHEALKAETGGDVSYWPSFEMVRWLGGHFGHDFEAAFGGDDGNNRHVSTWLVDAIVDLFVETYSVTR